MGTPYKTIFDGVVDKMRSTGIADITEDEFDEILMGYIRPATVRFRACRQDLSDRDDALAMFTAELTDEEVQILVNFVYTEFLSANYINVPSLLRQSLVSRDYHAFSSANHLKGLMDLRETVLRETRQMISLYSHMHSELFGRLMDYRDGERADGAESEGGGPPA